MFRYYVDGALFRGSKVPEGVFGVGEAASESDGKERRVMVYDLSIGEGGEIGRRACRCLILA